MINQCLEFNQYAHGGLGSIGEIGMIGIPYGPNTTNSPFGGASWCMLLSNNSSPLGRPKNLATILDPLNFPHYLTNESHWQ